MGASKVCSSNDPTLTLTYLTSRSNLLLYAFICALWERVDLLALVCGRLTVSLPLSHWYPESGVVLDYIDS